MNDIEEIHKKLVNMEESEMSRIVDDLSIDEIKKLINFCDEKSKRSESQEKLRSFLLGKLPDKFHKKGVFKEKYPYKM